jgi:ribosomal protein L36
VAKMLKIAKKNIIVSEGVLTIICDKNVSFKAEEVYAKCLKHQISTKI